MEIFAQIYCGGKYWKYILTRDTDQKLIWIYNLGSNQLQDIPYENCPILETRNRNLICCKIPYIEGDI